jgi:hypothetical protein
MESSSKGFTSLANAARDALTAAAPTLEMRADPTRGRFIILISARPLVGPSDAALSRLTRTRLPRMRAARETPLDPDGGLFTATGA